MLDLDPPARRVKRLTDYADCAGCASKLPAADLSDILTDLPAASDDRVLVDFRTADDAGVYVWDGGSALVQTVDFFTPIVDDPYVFGQIAAVNALSDIFAMGATPRTALAIAALPKNGPSADVIRAIFRGGSDILRSRQVALLGGHTVSDPEIKFGYAVTGAVDAARVLTNAGARPGDWLILTKPLGTGIIVRARKFGEATDDELAGAVETMLRLNDEAIGPATPAAAGYGRLDEIVRACTDVTGFGLAGHASEMAEASGTTLLIDAGELPVLPGAERWAAAYLPCGGRANQRHFGRVEALPTADPTRVLICLDPQTSGGLLLAIDPRRAPAFLERIVDAGVAARAIGRVEPRDPAGTLVQIR